MSKKNVDTLPSCAVCGKPANYDVPVPGFGGSWANLCKVCARAKGVGDEQINLGTEFVHRTQQPKQGKTVMGEEPGLPDIEYWESVLYDGVRTITCPACGEEHNVEPDATYTYMCGCGVTVQVPGGLF